MSAPFTRTVPRLGRKMPDIMLSVVVLPLPEGPTINNISPKWATRATPFTAVTLVSPVPNHFVRSVVTMASVAPGLAPAVLTLAFLPSASSCNQLSSTQAQPLLSTPCNGTASGKTQGICALRATVDNLTVLLQSKAEAVRYCSRRALKSIPENRHRMNRGCASAEAEWNRTQQMQVATACATH